ncbi:hypothetical protein AnigIFM56816_005092 [Aspergillus niger]|nr:hypothetical protein AnigIFM56816_005092 [Aspergillus niger]
MERKVLDYSWHDLSALSQTSQSWHDLAATELYKKLRIKFFDRTSLQNDIAELHPKGLGRQYLRHARDLDLVCLEKPWLATKTAQRLWQKKNWENEYVFIKPPASKDSFLQDSLLECHDFSLRFLTWTMNHYEQNDWKPVITLLSRLTHLRLLNYAVRNMFPTSLQQALHQFHPTCRLNIWATQSPTLDLPGLGRSHQFVANEFKQPFDLNILHAPTLNTFKAAYTIWRNPQSEPEWVHVDEPFAFIFMAPNLKHLIIDDMDALDYNPAMKVKAEWREFIAKTKPSPATVYLDSLTLIILEPYRPLEQILWNISSMVDLSRLRSLDIGVHSEPTMLSQAASFLISLERLYVHMVPWNKQRVLHWDSHSEDATWDIEEMVSAVNAFRPLRFLCLRGLRSFSSLERIVSHHNTLEGLSLEASDRQRSTPQNGVKYPIFNGDHIRWIAKLCPRLEEFRLPLQRTQGNLHECDVYASLGQFSRLRTVMLDLDCDPRHTPDDLEFPSPSCLRETLVNAAIDETLAKGIFNIIFSHQHTRTLKNVRVDPIGADNFERETEHVIRQVGRSFLVTRADFYLTAHQPVEVREVGRVAWQLWRENDIAECGSVHIPREIKDVLEEFWPLQSDRNRSKKWKEFPLLVRSFPLESMY